MKYLTLSVLLISVLMISVPASFTDGETDAAGFTNYYDQLDSNGQTYYDACVKNITPNNLETKVSLPNPFATITSESSEKYLKDLYADMALEARYAMELDLPMAFWVWQGVKIINGYTMEKTDSVSYIKEISVKIEMPPSYADNPATKDVNELEVKINELKAAVDNFKTTSTDPVGKVKEINQFLVHDNNLIYDPDVNKVNMSPYSHDAYGALVALHSDNTTHFAVCDGYSEAFQLLCEKAGIKSTIIYGMAHQPNGSELHAWNNVFLNGEWYAVDSTWNSEDDAYLLVGSHTEIDNVPFIASHSPGNLDLTQPLTFVPPTLSQDSYDGVTSDSDIFSSPFTMIVVVLVAIIIVGFVVVNGLVSSSGRRRFR